MKVPHEDTRDEEHRPITKGNTDLPSNQTYEHGIYEQVDNEEKTC